MTDFYSAGSIPEPLPLVADASARFYVVSRRKLAILYLATLGIYGLYWFYQNWARYNRHCPDAKQAGNGIWPIPRAIFSVFFTHDLFAKIHHHGRGSPFVAGWDHRPQATILVVLTLVSNGLNRLSMKEVGSPYTDILSLVLLLPLLNSLMQVQEMINASCRDPEGKTNAALGAANYAWIIGGALFWVLVIIGLLLG